MAPFTAWADSGAGIIPSLRAKVSAHKVGDTITLTIDRNNHERTVDVTLEEMPQDKK